MLKYPDDFNTPAFPAGRFVATSRFMGVAVMVLFFLIVCLCGVIMWAKKSQSVVPFLVSITPGGERWTMVAHNDYKTKVPAYYVLQESLLDNFARNWFTIYDTSDNIFANQAIWAECTRDADDCASVDSSAKTCAIYCATNDVVFDNFKKVVLPVYTVLQDEDNAVWTVKYVNAQPVDGEGSVTQNGGLWRLNVMVNTGLENVVFMGYASVGYDPLQYKNTMGYYIADFNMYRMN